MKTIVKYRIIEIIKYYINYYIQVVIAMANVNNTSSYMEESKKQIIKESNYTYRDALEVSAFLIETGRFERFYKEMQIHDLQKELDEMGDEE